MGRLTERPPPVGHPPPQVSASDDTARVRLTSSLIGWNQFLQEPPVINVRVLRSHSFLLSAAAEEALQGSWTSSPMCVCECVSGRERGVCVWVRGEQSRAERENVGDYWCRGCCVKTGQLSFLPFSFLLLGFSLFFFFLLFSFFFLWPWYGLNFFPPLLSVRVCVCVCLCGLTLKGLHSLLSLPFPLLRGRKQERAAQYRR